MFNLLISSIIIVLCVVRLSLSKHCVRQRKKGLAESRLFIKFERNVHGELLQMFVLQTVFSIVISPH
jgi:hypothetical protein